MKKPRERDQDREVNFFDNFGEITRNESLMSLFFKKSALYQL